MSRWLKTQRARRDLKEIWQYIAAHNPAAADNVLDKISKTCDTLADYPKLGHSKDELAHDLRYFPSGKYIILYKLHDDCIIVVRIIHGARYLPELL